MPSDTVFPLLISINLLVLVFASAVVYILVLQRKRSNEHLLETERLASELERKKIQQSFEERELMMDQISKEVHDNIGQVSYLCRMRIHELNDVVTTPQQIDLTKEVGGLVDMIISQTKHISQSLNSSYIKERGLYSMLEYDVEIVNASGQLACYLDVTGDHQRLQPEAQLVVYRIAQEAMHNVLKHAQARLLEIELAFSPEEFKMVVWDDGIGMDIAHKRGLGTLGLKNMQQRANLLNGHFEINSEMGKGTKIVLIAKAQ